MAQDRGLRLLGLSEIYGFNVWDDHRAAQVMSLADVAEASGAETVSLIPCVDDRSVTPLRDVLRELVPLFKGRSVIPLLEPIGFTSSSIPHKAELVRAIDALDPDLFRMVHDTFQHCISGETELFPELTGMVHISGISAADAKLDQIQDAHRVWVDADDRCGNVDQLRDLLGGGYLGSISFECTEDGLWETDGLNKARRSFEYIERALG